MMHAIINRVEFGRGLLQIVLELFVYTDDDILGEVTARHSRLVRYEDGEPAAFVQHSDGFRRIREELKTGRVVNVANFLGNRSITIDKYGWPLHSFSRD